MVRTELRKQGWPARRNNSGGFALPTLLIFLALSAAILIGWAKLSMSASRTAGSVRIRTSKYNQAESGLNIALSWLRDHSTDMYSLFTKGNICNYFEPRAASPGYSANDPSSGSFAVPSRMRWKSTTSSPVLSNDAALGTTVFQNVGSFNTASSFGGLNFGGDLVKVALVDALPLDPTVATACPAPATDFYPIFRIDSMTGNQSGSRVFSYVSGDLQQNGGIPGFYTVRNK